MELTDLYFAYGADLDVETLRSRCGRCEVVSVARLAGFRLAFFGHDGNWDSGRETLIPDPASEAWGVLYRLSDAAWESLDACMGAGLDGTGPYFHYPVEVTTPAGETCLVRIFRKDLQGEPRTPSQEYLALIEKGAAAHGLPTAYREMLHGLASHPAKYPVPASASRRHRSLPMLP